MVIPFWVWARRELAEEGLRDVDRQTILVAAAGFALLFAIHGLSYRFLRD
jgi:hypothetical protein